MTFGTNNFAFQSCDNNELKCINCDIPFDKNNVNHRNSRIEHKSQNLYSGDVDKNLCNVNNCKYNIIEEFQSPKNIGNFNIFHNNLNGLENKFEVFHHFRCFKKI